jgi:hypothetical protein
MGGKVTSFRRRRSPCLPAKQARRQFPDSVLTREEHANGKIRAIANGENPNPRFRPKVVGCRPAVVSCCSNGLPLHRHLNCCRYVRCLRHPGCCRIVFGTQGRGVGCLAGGTNRPEPRSSQIRNLLLRQAVENCSDISQAMAPSRGDQKCQYPAIAIQSAANQRPSTRIQCYFDSMRSSERRNSTSSFAMSPNAVWKSFRRCSGV